MVKEILNFDEVKKLKTKLIKKKTKLSYNAELILKERYLKKGFNKNIETPEERYASLAIDIASVEAKENIETFATTLYDKMITKKFQFNSPTIINFGRWDNKSKKQKDQMGSACFVLPIADKMVDKDNGEGILDISVAQALVHKSGGGTGYSFCRLRPAGSIIGYDPEVDDSSFDWDMSAGISSGPVSFMEHIYDSNTESIKQGNTRRGANMGIQRIDHPDFLAHMYAKFNVNNNNLERKLKNHNCSLGLTDNFMKAVKNNGYYKLFNPHTKTYLNKKDVCSEDSFKKLLEKNKQNPANGVTLPSLYLSKNGRDLLNAYTGELIGFAGNDVLINARTVLNVLTKLTHANGEPGVIYIDRMNEFNPTPRLGEIESTNPCGEQPLLDFEACNLGSINTTQYVKNGKIDEDSLKKDIKIFIRALDNVVSRNDFPLQKISDAVEKTRKIGLGYMGIADSFLMMGIKYGTEESFKVAENLAKILADTAREASYELGAEKGIFPAFKDSIFDKNSDVHKQFMQTPRIMDYNGKPRNAAMTTQAPTGTISRLTSCSSGIEPLFSAITISNIMNQKVIDISYSFYNSLLKEGIISQETINNFDKLTADENYNLNIDNSVSEKVREELMIFKAVNSNKGNLEVNENTPKGLEKYLMKIPKTYKDNFITGRELDSGKHLNMQNIFQKYNDSSISKTIIMSQDSTSEDILKAYIKGWELNLKGLTVYRDNSRDFQIFNVSKDVVTKEKNGYNRPLLQMSITTELPVGNPLLNSGDQENKSYKVFTTIGYDPLNKKINSVFQNTSYGDSFEITHMIAENKSYSEILKLCNGSAKKLEKHLLQLPTAHHSGSLSEDGSFKNRINNDTTEGALLKSLQTFKFLSDNYTNFDEIDKKYKMICLGDILLKKVIESKGTVELKHKESKLSIFPQGLELIFDPTKYIGSSCPYCGQEFKTDEDKRKFVTVIEGCPTYLCCGASKCG